MANEEILEESNIVETDAAKLQPDWENPPSISDLKADFDSALPAHHAHTVEVKKWLDNHPSKQQLRFYINQED